jgi:hypothetical protein
LAQAVNTTISTSDMNERRSFFMVVSILRELSRLVHGLVQHKLLLAKSGDDLPSFPGLWCCDMVPVRMLLAFASATYKKTPLPPRLAWCLGGRGAGG